MLNASLNAAVADGLIGANPVSPAKLPKAAAPVERHEFTAEQDGSGARHHRHPVPDRRRTPPEKNTRRSSPDH
jgi:hypothetical protein